MEKILIVDDAELNRAMLACIFEEQYEIIEAPDGEVAIEIIDQMKTEISLIFLDLLMPRKNGLDVLAFLRKANLIDYIPVMMITGESTEASDMKAYEFGAADIIYKPFSPQVVTRRAMNLIEQYKVRVRMEEELAARTAEVEANRKNLEEMNNFLLDALGTIVEFRSEESGRHVQRVKYFTKLILEYVMSCYPEYKLTKKQIALMSQAAALHDVGKIAIRDDILKAPRKLDKVEFAEMKKHTIYGCEILERFKLKDDEFYRYCYEICRWHHEKYDGKGYPDGLVGDEIPIYAQAAGLADAFDALVSKRVYKEAVSPIEAYNMIMRGECGAYSEVILKCFELAKLEMFMTVEKMMKGEELS